MADLADGFIAPPLRARTLEELAEVASWAQLGSAHEADRLLGPNHYWAPS